MVIIKNVIVSGASGALGKPILKALIDSEKFNIAVLARQSSKATFPASVKIIKADFNSVDSLTAALRGQDAVVSTVGTEGLLGQSLVIDAAVAAGTLPVFGHKVATQKHIEEKAASNSDFSYTLVRNGAFLDWGLEAGFIANPNKTRVFDSGDQLWSTTTLESIALAVVGVLTHFKETKNRANKLRAIGKKLAPEQPWELIPTSLVDVKKAADAELAKGNYTGEVMAEFLRLAIFGEGYGGLYTKLDNELFGVPGKTEAELEAIYKSILARGVGSFALL